VTWTGGGANANWSTAANWSPAAVPGIGTNAIFGAISNARTNVNLSAMPTVKGILFTPDANAYTFGPLAQTIGLGANCVVALSAGSANDQFFNCILRCEDRNGGTIAYTIINDDPLHTLTIELVHGGTQGDTQRAITIAGSGPVRIGTLRRGSSTATKMPIILALTNTLTLTSATNIDRITFTAPATVALGAGEHILNNLASSNGDTLVANEDAVVNGPGVIAIQNTAVDIYATAGKTLTLNAGISGAGKGIELPAAAAGGTVILAAASTYDGATSVNAGTLVLAGDGSVPGSAVTVAAGAALRLAGGGATHAAASLAGAGDLVFGVADGLTDTLEVNGAAAAAMLEGLTVSGIDLLDTRRPHTLVRVTGTGAVPALSPRHPGGHRRWLLVYDAEARTVTLDPIPLGTVLIMR
jgi:fibronectin-binding autotransporter adhesin